MTDAAGHAVVLEKEDLTMVTGRLLTEAFMFNVC